MKTKGKSRRAKADAGAVEGADHDRRRDDIVRAAEMRGLSWRILADWAGLPGAAGAMRITRWRRGEARLPDDAIRQIETALARVAEESPDVDRAALEQLAGDAPADDRDPLRTMAQRHRRLALGGIIRIAMTAASEAVRLRAWEALLDRADGRAAQTVIDATPQAPTTDEDLRAALSRLRAVA